jgi:hypothetical protein
MALILADRVLETSTSEGLGTFALAGAQTGYQTFSSGIGNGNTCYYTINGQTTEQWEVGIGTVGAGTLARTTLISSNTGSFINFVAGVKNVFVTQPASKSIYKDENGNAIPLGSASATQLDITAQGDLRLQDTTGGEYVAIQAPATLASSYTLTMPVDDGTAGQALVTDGSGVLSWSSAASGDVYGPASATDNAVARYDGTTGKIIQNSAVTIADDGATVIDVNSTSAGLRITQVGTGNALLVEDSANPDATPVAIDASGNVLVGITTAQTINGITPAYQQLGAGNYSSIWTGRYSANATANYIYFSKSRSATVGTNTIVSSGDDLGTLGFFGADGTNLIEAANIVAEVDGTPGTNDMPGRLTFNTTADGASSSTERMRIDSAGRVGIGSSSLAGFGVRQSNQISGNSFSRAYLIDSTNAADVSNTFIGFGTALPTANAVSNLQHFSAGQGTLTGAVTNQFGFNVASSLTGATNNYGFYSAIASGTGRWNFYAAGSADNFMSGNLGVTGTPDVNLHVANGSAKLRLGATASNAYLDISRDSASGFSIYNAAQTSFSAHIFQIVGTERARIATTGTISLGAAPGSESLRVTPVASAVNYINVQGGATGGGAAITTQGSDTNVGMFLSTKGAGQYFFSSNSVTQFNIGNTASTVNYLRVDGGATGNAATLSVVGSDTNIDLALTPKGTGKVRFGTHTGTADVAITGYIEVKDSAGNVRKLAVITYLGDIN